MFIDTWVGQSVGQSVGRSVGRSVGHEIHHCCCFTCQSSNCISVQQTHSHVMLTLQQTHSHVMLTCQLCPVSQMSHHKCLHYRDKHTKTSSNLFIVTVNNDNNLNECLKCKTSCMSFSWFSFSRSSAALTMPCFTMSAIVSRYCTHHVTISTSSQH